MNPTMDLDAFFATELDRHSDVLAATREAVVEPFCKLVGVCARALGEGGKIVLFGNGGSAADAQHLATEFTVRYKDDRAPMAAIALTTDTSILTAIGNDLGFDDLFARQVRALGRAGDVALGISTSGNSENVIRALAAAREMAMVAAGFGGGDGGRMQGLARSEEHTSELQSH